MAMIEVTCQVCGKVFKKRRTQVRKNNFCCQDHCRQWQAEYLSEYNRTVNPMNRTGVPLSVRIKRSRALRGLGEGKAYRKLLGRHEHRTIAEELIGRHLLTGEVVHHIDEDKLNNDPVNLSVLHSQSEHVRKHQRDERGRWCK